MSSPQSKARVIGLMRPLKDVTVTAGETATFECELSYEGIAVEWFLGGTKLEPSDRVSPNTPDWVLTMFLYHNQAHWGIHFLKTSWHTRTVDIHIVFTDTPWVQDSWWFWSRAKAGVSLSICTQCSVFFAPRCSSFSLSSYKGRLVEVQDSSWALDPGFEITQAGRLFCPASVSAGLFLTAAGGWDAGQVATGAIWQPQF